jgi:biopolymer transport protein ExbD
MKVSHLNTRPPRVEMLPLIDIVFLLLVVFIYTMLSMAVHKGLPVNLPSGDEVQIDKQTPISVTVNAAGEIFIDKRPVSLEGLLAELKTVSQNDREKGVLLFADRELAYGELFTVLDRIHRAGLYRVSLQSESEVQP